MEMDARREIETREMENITNESTAEDTVDLTAPNTQVTEALKELTSFYGNSETRLSLQRFFQRIKSVKTSNQLNSLLNCAGSSVRYGAGRGKIPCQPTSLARRSPGMPRGAAPIGKGRRPAAAQSSKPKRPRNLAHSVACNITNAKPHGSGH